MIPPWPSSGKAETGKARIETPKSKIRSTDQTNSGITAAESPPTVINLSANFPRFIAASIPPRTLNGTMMRNATSAIWADLVAAGASSSETGISYVVETPRLPLINSLFIFMNWVTSGLSRPCSFLYSSTDSIDASRPSFCRATSPGSTFVMKKTIMVTTTMVIAESKMRLKMNRYMILQV